MCGPEDTNRPRGGALAVLSSLRADARAAMNADLAFHTPGSPTSHNATHVRITPSHSCNMADFQNLHIVIQ